VFPLPDGVEPGDALSLIIQGLTAWHLYRTQGRVAEGESVVVISGAGGVGNIAVQLGKSMGAGRVIATASTEEKRRLCLELGAHAAVDSESRRPHRRPDRRPTRASGWTWCSRWPAAGSSTSRSSPWPPSAGWLTYGIASREPNQVATGQLMRRSRSVVGFWLMHCLGRRDMVEEPLEDLFGRVARASSSPRWAAPIPCRGARGPRGPAGPPTTGKLLLDPTA